MEDKVNTMAAALHEEWRKGYQGTATEHKARMKDDGKGGQVDINAPFDTLPEKWKAENLAAAKAAYEAVQTFPDDREAGADHIHKKWLERNGSWAPAEQNKPYAELSEVEKDKDRVHYDMMKNMKGGRRRKSRKSKKSIKKSKKTRRH